MGAIVGALIVGLPTAASATTRTVGPGQSIQAAINASQNGDTINVSPGTYNENITISGKYISLIGSVTDPANTIIHAAHASAAVVFVSNVPWVSGRKTIISGFTIAGGDAPGGQGGGITVFNGANPEISNNVITGNVAHGYGGGIMVFTNATPIIRDNTISNNVATAGGGGIFVYNGSSPIIYGNTITNNRTFGASIADGGSSGGGIYLENTSNPSLRSNPVVLNNQIDNNNAEFAGGGIMVRTGANAIIEGNHVGNNKAAYGGGIHLESTGATNTVTSNVIEGNTATYNPKFAGSGVGGGIAVFDSSVATITSNTIRGNAASSIGGGIASGESANTTLTGNLITGNYVSPGGNSQQGGGLYAANSTLTATNNQFSANSASIGGAIALTSGNFSVVNNTIVRNHATKAAGGAIYGNAGSGSISLVNNILTQNDGYQIFLQAPPARLDNNLITTPGSTPSEEGNGLYFDYARRVTTLSALNAVPNAHNNVVADPTFTNYAGGDFSIRSNSPAINAATNNSIPDIANDYRLAIRDTSALDIGAFEYVASPQIPAHVYRFWSESKKGHFFTITQSERDLVASTYNPVEWRYEGMAFDAFTSQVAGTIPLYRFYSASYQSHFYTANAGEANGLRSDPAMKALWNYENIAYYVYPLGTGLQSREVYRFWSQDNKHHFYTSSAAESVSIQRSFARHVWAYEGANFQVPK